MILKKLFYLETCFCCSLEYHVKYALSCIFIKICLYRKCIKCNTFSLLLVECGKLTFNFTLLVYVIYIMLGYPAGPENKLWLSSAKICSASASPHQSFAYLLHNRFLQATLFSSCIVSFSGYFSLKSAPLFSSIRNNFSWSLKSRF